ncbi:hypothetical protein C8J57DRAFT_1324523 [Mycena rebaudengoi]|nr:hypothetical protein C8J57DRAFT_1324523 [Mycena rebaudengoi]
MLSCMSESVIDRRLLEMEGTRRNPKFHSAALHNSNLYIRTTIVFYGLRQFPKSGNHPTQKPFTVNDFPVPNSPLTIRCERTTLVKTHFPHWSYDGETYYLACLLHDIGTAENFLATTKMPFEFKGAIVTRDLLIQLGGVEDQAKEHILVEGHITQVGQTVQLTIILGTRTIHPKFIKTTTVAFPRNGWSDHFARAFEKEVDFKPWCHGPGGMPSNVATHVRRNDVMRSFD